MDRLANARDLGILRHGSIVMARAAGKVAIEVDGTMGIFRLD